MRLIAPKHLNEPMQRRLQRGANLVEFSLAAVLLFTLIFVIIDLARLFYSQAIMNTTLALAIKRAQSEFNTVVEFDQLETTDQKYRDFQKARVAIADQVSEGLRELRDSKTIEFYQAHDLDELRTGINIQPPTLVAYLLPGKASLFIDPRSPDTSPTTEQNQNVCRSQSGATIGAETLVEYWSSNSDNCSAPQRRIHETYLELKTHYPLELVSKGRFNGIILKGLPIVSRVAGYLPSKTDGPSDYYQSPTPTPTQPVIIEPTPTASPTYLFTPPTVPTNTPPLIVTPLLPTPSATPTPSLTPTLIPTINRTSTPLPTLTETMAPTRTSTPTITPSPQPPQCKYFDMSGWACDTRQPIYMGCNDGSLWGKTVMSIDASIKSKFTQLQCIKNIFAQCGIGVDDKIRGTSRDFCVQSAFINIKRGVPINTPIYTRGTMDGRFVMDENCQVVHQSTPAEICGRAIYRADTTPISLILDSSHPLPVSIVTFDLDNSNQQKFFTWRASDRSPLLVLDPHKRGQITSSKQLFGNWTFGGKELVDPACRISKNKDCAYKPWDNGFSALESLDSDENLILSSQELKHISLWFDKNQNALSEPGEVIDLGAYGITRIFLKEPIKNGVLGDLTLVNGAELSNEQTTRHLNLVDWTSMTSESRTELIESIKNLPAVKALSEQNPLRTESELMPTPHSSASNTLSAFVGAWRWKLEKGQDQVFGTNGIFEFAHEEKNMHGSNVIIRPVLSASAERFREIIINELQNLKVSDGLITFESKDDQGNVVYNSASLDPSTNRLRGTSKTTLKNLTPIRYSWEAERLNSAH